MKRLFTLFIISGAALTLTQCATKKAAVKTPAEPTTPEAIVAEVKRNYTPAQMDEGKMIWEAKCGTCHKLYAPQSRMVPTWENVLVRMNPKAKLNEEEAGKVRAYVLTNAKM